MVYHRMLNRVLCAMKWDLEFYPFYTSANPNLPLHPPASLSLLATTCLFSMSLTPLLFILAVRSLHCCVGFSLAVSGGYSLAAITGFSPPWLLSFKKGFSRCGVWSQLRRMGLFASQPVESSWTRDWTLVPSCIGRWLLNHRAMREVPESHSWALFNLQL